jgi:hypothetical protein
VHCRELGQKKPNTLKFHLFQDFTCFCTIVLFPLLPFYCFFSFLAVLGLFRSPKLSSLFSSQFQVALFYFSLVFSEFYLILLNCVFFRMKSFLLKKIKTFLIPGLNKWMETSFWLVADSSFIHFSREDSCAWWRKLVDRWNGSSWFRFLSLQYDSMYINSVTLNVLKYS